jgi:phage pi2 protein 07
MSDEELEKVLREVSSEVLNFYDPHTTETVARDIRYQSTVSMWSCLEVLLRNYINANFNKNPHLIELILKNQKLKKEIGLDKIEISNLIEYNFDLRNNIGDLIFKHQNSKKIGNIQSLIELMNPNLKAVSRLNNGRLKNLNLKRNLITHHRGMCDSEYKEKSNTTIEVGQLIDVTPGSLVNFYREVSQFALDLANSIDHKNAQ